MHLILIPVVIILLIYIFKTKKNCNNEIIVVIPIENHSNTLKPLTTPPMKSSPILLSGPTGEYSNML